jgi:hypothetical protein
MMLLGVAVWMRMKSGAPGGGPDFGLDKRFMQVSYVWTYFVWKPWVPFHLTPLYTQLLDFRAADLPFVLSAVALAGTTVLLVCFRARWKLGMALWVFHLAMVFPMCGWIEQKYFPSDRYNLMASMVWSVLLVAGLWRWRERLRWRRAALAAASLLLVGLAVLTHRQEGRWKTGTVFFDYVLSQMDRDTDVYYGTISYRLGCAYLEATQYAQAERAFRETVRVTPSSKTAHAWLATTLALEKKSDEAEKSFKRALALAPDYVYARKNLGILYFWRNQLDEAAAQFEAVLRLDPNDAEAHQNLAAVLQKQGKPDEAAVHHAIGERLKAASH